MNDSGGPTLLDATPVLTAIKSRRVTRLFTPEPVAEESIRAILEAARWAPSAGMRRLNRYIVVQRPLDLRLLRAVSPGIVGPPPAIIVICVDRSELGRIDVDDSRLNSSYVDVGTAAQTMLLAAAELGLGACPVMSFHREAVQLLLEMPAMVEPVMMIVLGYADEAAAARPRRKRRLQTVDEVTSWNSYARK